jgi:hypothetical protein
MAALEASIAAAKSPGGRKESAKAPKPSSSNGSKGSKKAPKKTSGAGARRKTAKK